MLVGIRACECNYARGSQVSRVEVVLNVDVGEAHIFFTQSVLPEIKY